jgi:hypothetical protein
MKIKTLFLVALLLSVSPAANADLFVRGMGTINGVDGEYKLIYDDIQDITWLDYTNAKMDWNSQRSWALDLVVSYGEQELDDWRRCDGEDRDLGKNVTSSEMGHLFYVSLGNGESGGLQNAGPFDELLNNRYWSQTPYSTGSSYSAFYFAMEMGAQGYGPKNGNRYGLTVRNGDVPQSPVPVPGAVWLLGSGLLGLTGIRSRRNR